jgi:hypothetical protein
MNILSGTPGRDEEARIKDQGRAESQDEATESSDLTRRQDEERDSDLSEDAPEDNEAIGGIDYGGDFNLDLGGG